MPGITGIISRKPAAECERIVQAMLATMGHEVFYRCGTCSAPSLGVYAGWTWFADSPGPIRAFWDEGPVGLILAGECFADEAANQALEKRGRLLDGNPFGWIVQLYEELGPDFVEKINGLFSGLLIDRRSNRAFLFNDRYGVQRLYWHETDGDFYFASEAKALLRVLPGLREFDDEGVAEFLTFNCPLDDRTLFKGIKRLPGGSRVAIDQYGIRRDQYFSAGTWASQPLLSEAEYDARFNDVFNRVLPRYFEGAPKIGIALTGGLDTRMILAGRPRSRISQTAYTFTGPGRQTMDDRVAAQVARSLGMDHQLLRLGPDFFSNFGSHADKTVYVTDGCFGLVGSHEIYFNRQARNLAPVRLTGNYGSEVLRGISMFKSMPLASGLLNPDWEARVNAAKPRLAAYKKHPVTMAAFHEIPWLAYGNLMAGWSQVSFRTPYLDNEVVALAYQAAPATRFSSLPALRYIRNNNRTLAAIPTDRGFIGEESGPGIFLRRVFAEVSFKLDYHNGEGLPPRLSPLNPVFRGVTSLLGVAGLHKFLRYSSWYRNELRDFLRDRLASPFAMQARFWNPKFVAGMAADHISGRQNHGLEINKVLTLEAVERVLFRDLPR